ncbi:hypothetical protein 1 [Hubei sobemo-like virus 49]|uniref:hypothetical protein 1 n=1 Tax=Hubei sobemo-like virus 49 TaxID=1923237 RepID=UPI00090B4A38|nr:hypothetical protein 1 [Hubei sobemo-like virus 49]APG75768.1 hypothetical protein 1 [Hubei sobemo-like virus 49]
MACFSDMLIGFDIEPVERRSLSGVVMDGTHFVYESAKDLVTTVAQTRTKGEIVLGTMVFGGLVYKCYEYSVPTKILRCVSSVVPGYRWVKARLGKYDVVSAAPRRMDSVLESRRTGSDETPMTPPRHQAVVAIRDGDIMRVLGCAVRFNNTLVGPDHVLGGTPDVEKFVKGSQSWVALASRERIPLDTDLVAIEMSDKDFASIGISACKVAPMGNQTEFAQIVGPDAKGTVGQLKHDAICFGRLVYTGTTIQGYSGAAYTMGPKVMGIHQMGGAVNGGYSAEYINNLLLVHFKQRYESSPEWLLSQYEAGRTMSWKRTGDPSTYQLKVGGRYALVDRDDMDAAFGEHWRDSEVIQNKRDVRHRDYESTGAVANFLSNSAVSAPSSSGEANGSRNLGALSVVDDSQGLEMSGPQKLMAEYAKLSNAQRKRFRQLSNLSPRPIEATAGQARQTNSQS